jgi:uncharacterized membrane protein YqaE (UPF0057 family)
MVRLRPAPAANQTPPAATRRRQLMNKLLLIIIAIFLPPLAVYLKSKALKTTVLNLILTLLFWVPGFLHALYVILT